MYKFFRRVLFCLPSELSHNFIVKLGCFLQRREWLLNLFFPKQTSQRKICVAGMEFPGPVGLAAGFDKNAELVYLCSRLGFASVEVGTITPLAQAGNPKPRLFRFPRYKAILNRMGFNNHGAQAVLKNLLKWKSKLDIPIGVNIGKNKVTANENAIEDYRSTFATFIDLADYFVVNLSSPNTPGLRDLQSEGFLKEIVRVKTELNIKQPIFVKLAPDLENNDLVSLCQSVQELGFSGLILTNTTIEKEYPEIYAKGAGGVSGDPLCIRSRECLLLARKACSLPIISVGGILNYEEVQWRLQHGAQLVQIYSALIFEGPLIAQSWNNKWLQDG